VEAPVERRGKPPLSKRGKSNMQEADLFCMTNKERESLEEKKQIWHELTRNICTFNSVPTLRLDKQPFNNFENLQHMLKAMV
jgi:hypothetical protein